jgi:hypothetical protein
VAVREELVQMLVAEGWEEVAGGESWYGTHYRRWNEAEAAEEQEIEAPLALLSTNGGHGTPTATPSSA